MPAPAVRVNAVLGKDRLDGVPKLLVNNGRMFAGIAVALMCGLAAVGAVLQQQIERPMREPLPPVLRPIGVDPSLALDTSGGKFFGKRTN